MVGCAILRSRSPYAIRMGGERREGRPMGISCGHSPKRISSLANPSSTTCRPPERIIHSSRWSRYWRLKASGCSCCERVSIAGMVARASSTVWATEVLFMLRSSQASSSDPTGLGDAEHARLGHIGQCRKIAPGTGLMPSENTSQLPLLFNCDHEIHFLVCHAGNDRSFGCR